MHRRAQPNPQAFSLGWQNDPVRVAAHCELRSDLDLDAGLGFPNRSRAH